MDTQTASDTPPNLDEALFTLAPEGLGDAGSALGRTRLRTFITLRWLAVTGQTAAVLFAALWLQLEQPLSLVLGVIAASAWVNVFLSFAFPQQRLVSSPEAALQLGFDTVQLSALLALTGGLNNPFLLLLVVPVTVAAVSLRPVWAILLAVLALGLAAIMPLYAFPLPWFEGQTIELPVLYQWGQYSALAVGVVFFAITAWRVSQDEARLVRALDAAQVVLAREQRLSALGAMSAMTAHELGTPLATIHLVAREMAAELDADNPYSEDLKLLAEQAERCRSILGKLAQERDAGDIVHAVMPLRAVAEEAAAPHRGLGVNVLVFAHAGVGGSGKAPFLNRSPEVLHALSAFIENAVSFAETEVLITARWTDDKISFTVRDDGPGFASEVLPRLGEPYVSERGEDQAGGGDMGLGFFIAKTLVERTGGRIATRNASLPASGAVVQAVWPRKALESVDI